MDGMPVDAMDPGSPVSSASTGSPGSLHSMAAGGPTDMADMAVLGNMGNMGEAAHSAYAGHLGHMAHGEGMSSLSMLAAHTVAALLTGLWLAYGERAAFRLLRAVAARLAAPLRLPLAALPVPARRPVLRPTRERAEPLPRLTLPHTIISRGPPAATAVV